MAFYPAHCDNICTHCEKNSGGYCIWKDISTTEYKNDKTYEKPYEWGEEHGYIKH